MLNIEKFNTMLQSFMDLPELEQLLEMVKSETD